MIIKKKVDTNESLEKERKKFIEGAYSENALAKTNEWTKISLRIRNDTIEEIDQLIETDYLMNRTRWILEAIREKLEREKSYLKH